MGINKPDKPTKFRQPNGITLYTMIWVRIHRHYPGRH